MRLCLLLLCAGALFAQIRTLPARPQIICPGCTTITITGGNSQSGGPGSILKSPLSVKVTNTSTGIPVGQGLEIIFEVVASPTNSSGGGVSIDGINFFLGVEAFTAADGTASVQAELGDMPGQYQIQASCLGCVSPIFNENAIGCTASVRIATGGIFNSNMFGFFSPPSGATLADFAGTCGFKAFEWQQTITVLPCPNTFLPNNPSLIPLTNFCPGGQGLQVSAPSSGGDAGPISDPPNSGWTYFAALGEPSFNPFPYYFPASLAVSEEQSPTGICIATILGACIPLVTPDAKTLAFFDAPADSCLPGSFRNMCGGISAPPASFLAFTTALVGVNQDGTPSDPLFHWSWTDTFNGTSGGISRISNNAPVDPGSGTGGITITEINGVVLPPVVPPSEVAITASGLAYSRPTQGFIGSLRLTNVASTAVSGPFQIVFFGISDILTLVGATGNLSGTPYLTISTASLAPGQSISVNLQLKGPSSAQTAFTPALYAGGLN